MDSTVQRYKRIELIKRKNTHWSVTSPNIVLRNPVVVSVLLIIPVAVMGDGDNETFIDLH